MIEVGPQTQMVSWNMGFDRQVWYLLEIFIYEAPQLYWEP